MLYDDGTVSFSVESAWNEPNEVRRFIEERFLGIKLYFQSEEPGMCIYQTNDDTGLYFPEKYCLWIEDGTTEYYTTLGAMAKEVKNITGSKNLKTLDSCKKALETYSRNHSDLCYTLEEFRVVKN